IFQHRPSGKAARSSRKLGHVMGGIDPAALAGTLDTVPGPVIAVLQAGKINTGAFDDFAAIIPLLKAKGAWVHVDGAFGLWAQTSVNTS
ncbi:hypothetical protein ACC689_35205, partial [Rhizobium ruizarguesonis]